MQADEAMTGEKIKDFIEATIMSLGVTRAHARRAGCSTIARDRIRNAINAASEDGACRVTCGSL